jgi:transposase InsO family protein
MSEKRPDPQAVAQWRYQLIEEALDQDLHPLARGAILRRISKVPVRRPSGITKPVSLSTLYRWLERFEADGLKGLANTLRSDRGQVRRPWPPGVLEAAIEELTNDPGQSLSFLVAVLEARFAEQDVQIAPSTLQRRLSEHPDYKRIKRARKRVRRRTRFCAKAPHDIWQTDAKGPVSVRLKSGQERRFFVLSILDDATRAVLAAMVSLRANLAAAVKVFRMAALRWGLPKKLYADRASIFDAIAFRSGLALMGDHRIPTQARNAEARGKIEAYHRVLEAWFTGRLANQGVVDLLHLQQLLDGVIDGLYMPHRHRSLKCSPAQALGGKVSERAVPPTCLVDAFRQERRLKSHRKTGEVVIAQTTYLVPDHLRGQRLVFRVDLVGDVDPVVKDPHSQQELPLRRAQLSVQDHPAESPDAEPIRWGPGPLQTIFDTVRGQSRPLAEPGFGLPEIYALLGKAAGRHVPHSDAEAALVQRVYREIGPLPRAATEAAMAAIERALGPGRPIKTYLDALSQRVIRNTANTPNP